MGTEFLASPLGTVAMPLSQMFDKVFGMIKSDMYAIKLQEKERELSVLDMTTVATQWGQVPMW